MDRKRTLTIVRGANAQAARRKPAAISRQQAGTRVQVFPGQVGVAVRRDHTSLPPATFGNRYGEIFAGCMGQQLDRVIRRRGLILT